MNVMFVSPRLTNTGYAVVAVDVMEPVTWSGIHKGINTHNSHEGYVNAVAMRLKQVADEYNVQRIVIDSNAIYRARADNHKRLHEMLHRLLMSLFSSMTLPYSTDKDQKELRRYVKRNFKVLYDKRVGVQTIRAFAMALDIDRSEYDSE